MKKIKFLGAAVLAASLIFAGCANGSDDEDYSAPETPAVENPTDSGDGTDQNNNNNNGGDTDNNNGENNNGGNNGGNNNGGNTGNNNSGNNGGNNSGNNGGNNSGETETEKFKITLTDATNDYEYADGVYTISLNTPHAANDEWGNQIFIEGVNETAEIANGDKIKTSVTVKADKPITTFLFKNQFHTGDPYPGITKSVSLEADTETTVDIYGNVFDYDETNTLVIAIRGNEADTTLTLKDVKVEKLGNYAVESIAISPASKTIKEGETVTFQAVDQYGFEIPEATFDIVSDSVSTLSGKVLTAAAVDETVTVRATYESFEATATITVEKIAVATESWGLDLSNDATNIGVLPLVNVAGWGGANTEPVVVEFAGRKAVKYTIPASYGWIGAAWQGDPNVNKIDVSGYSSITITYNDSEFAEGESLTDYNLKIKSGNTEVPKKGSVSAADTNGWKTITIPLSDYVNQGVTLSEIVCINFCDWKVGEPIDDKGNRANPGAGALYISEVSFNPASEE